MNLSVQPQTGTTPGSTFKIKINWPGKALVTLSVVTDSGRSEELLSPRKGPEIEIEYIPPEPGKYTFILSTFIFGESVSKVNKINFRIHNKTPI